MGVAWSKAKREQKERRDTWVRCDKEEKEDHRLSAVGAKQMEGLDSEALERGERMLTLLSPLAMPFQEISKKNKKPKKA